MTSKTYVITGCSSGIGKALTAQLLEGGQCVCGISRDVAKVEDFLENKSFTHFQFDLTDIDGIGELCKMMNLRAGAINGFIHSAGVEMTVPLHLIRYEKYADLFKLNTFSAFELIKFLSKKGYYVADDTSFVLISSLATQIGAQGKAIYAASKGALEGYLKPAAKELLKKGIRLNMVSPGVLKTPMNEGYFEKMSDEQQNELNGAYPLGIGLAEYVADTIRFLLSEQSKWMTAQNITLDGGNLIH
ncbi:MAG TPA: SDR family oxidoreductase [Thermotogota bacterium]|nr:SDR family oxidoreductase [Thermotogota bacterium]HPR95374.1 SDR family oxidoreductase [Thermotogota bacterium]